MRCAGAWDWTSPSSRSPTLLHFRHLLEKHDLCRKLLESQGEIFEGQGWIMRWGSIVDATIIAAPVRATPVDTAHANAQRAQGGALTHSRSLTGGGASD